MKRVWRDKGSYKVAMPPLRPSSLLFPLLLAGGGRPLPFLVGQSSKLSELLKTQPRNWPPSERTPQQPYRIPR